MLVLFSDISLSSLCVISSHRIRSNLLLYIRRRQRCRGENLHLLSGEQHIPPLVDLPDESLCFSHAVVALPLPLQMLHLQEIQLGSEEGTETPRITEEKRTRKD